MKYLSKRPFLVVTFLTRPKPNVNTSQRGWMDNKDNIQVYEQVSVVDRITPSLRHSSGIIVDIIKAEMVTNQTGIDDTLVLAEYISRYEDTIKAAIARWSHGEVDAEFRAQMTKRFHESKEALAAMDAAKEGEGEADAEADATPDAEG